MNPLYSDLKGMPLHGIDGTVGMISDLLIDVNRWVIRYLVIDTGTWLPGRKVLLPPLVIGKREWSNGFGEVGLTRQTVRESPDIDTAKPVSRQMEERLLEHFSVPGYWGPVGSALAGSDSSIPLSARPTQPQPQATSADSEPSDDRDPPAADPAAADSPAAYELRSINELSRYYVRASDGDMGHVHDFEIDDRGWMVRHVVLDTRNWLPGLKVCLEPRWITSISWDEATVTVGRSRAELRQLAHGSDSNTHPICQ